MKLLLDTNILIDFLAPREPYASDVRQLCIASFFGDVSLHVCTQSFADAYYVLCKKASPDRAKRAMLASLEFLSPLGVSAADLRPSLESDWSDIEDCLIAYSAKRMGADYVITRDVEMARKSPVAAMDAGRFLEYLRKEHGLAYEDVTLG